MESLGYGLFLVLLVFALVRGEEFKVEVSEETQIDEKGVCRKEVTVTGNGINDKLPVRCDTVDYTVTADTILVVGDKLYSEDANELMVMGPEGCEQRTYSDNKLADVKQLTDDECKGIKMSMIRVYMEATASSTEGKSKSEEDADESEKSEELREEELKSYDELRQWVSENLELESNEGVEKTPKEEKSEEDNFK